jgi:hypothetical protein
LFLFSFSSFFNKNNIVVQTKQFMISPPFWDNMTTPTDSVVIVDRLETQQEESDIDIDEDSSHVDPQTQYPFDFHFEFGSKRPPTVVPLEHYAGACLAK